MITGQQIFYSQCRHRDRTQYWNGSRRVEYVCRSYHRGGKAICSSHRVHEETLDEKVVQFPQKLHHKCMDVQAELKRLQRLWEMNRPQIEREIAELHKEITLLEREIDEILLDRISSQMR